MTVITPTDRFELEDVLDAMHDAQDAARLETIRIRKAGRLGTYADYCARKNSKSVK